MAKSPAKKRREKLEREGNRNPETKRGAFASNEMYKLMRTKAGKNKKDIQYRTKHKNRSLISKDGDSFLFWAI